jgi:hypothetical protein
VEVLTGISTCIFLLLFRCAVAVRSEWSTLDDCFRFLVADCEDDPETKLGLVANILHIADTLACRDCFPPQE